MSWCCTREGRLPSWDGPHGGRAGRVLPRARRPDAVGGAGARPGEPGGVQAARAGRGLDAVLGHRVPCVRGGPRRGSPPRWSRPTAATATTSTTSPRRVRREGPDSPAAAPRSVAPPRIPVLEADVSSFVVVRVRPLAPRGADVVPPGERGDAEHADPHERGCTGAWDDPAGTPTGSSPRRTRGTGCGSQSFPGSTARRHGSRRDARPPSSRYRSQDVPPGAQVGAGVLRRLGPPLNPFESSL